MCVTHTPRCQKRSESLCISIFSSPQQIAVEKFDSDLFRFCGETESRGCQKTYSCDWLDKPEQDDCCDVLMKWMSSVLFSCTWTTCWVSSEPLQRWNIFLWTIEIKGFFSIWNHKKFLVSLSASFEYLCYESTTIMFAWGPSSDVRISRIIDVNSSRLKRPTPTPPTSTHDDTRWVVVESWVHTVVAMQKLTQ